MHPGIMLRVSPSSVVGKVNLAPLVAEPGDDTVPENSGAGPFIRGGGNVRQSLRLEKMSEGHAGSYDDKNIRDITLYSIAKIIADKEAS